MALFIIIETSTALYNGFQADSTDLAISLLSGNSTFVPSGWIMHAWSQYHVYIIHNYTYCMDASELSPLNNYYGEAEDKTAIDMLAV